MKCAVLGNGPSRSAYVPRDDYDLVIGCNIPWAKVDCTVIMDENIVRLWHADHSLITVPAYFSRKAWMYADELKTFRPFILENNLLLGLFDKLDQESSGNAAARILVEKGYTYIDCYGCDAAFTEAHGHNIQSYTRKFISGTDMINNSYLWKLHWDKLVKQYPEVVFNFIRE